MCCPPCVAPLYMHSRYHDGRAVNHVQGHGIHAACGGRPSALLVETARSNVCVFHDLFRPCNCRPVEANSIRYLYTFVKLFNSYLYKAYTLCKNEARDVAVHQLSRSQSSRPYCSLYTYQWDTNFFNCSFAYFFSLPVTPRERQGVEMPSNTGDAEALEIRWSRYGRYMSSTAPPQSRHTNTKTKTIATQFRSIKAFPTGLPGLLWCA